MKKKRKKSGLSDRLTDFFVSHALLFLFVLVLACLWQTVFLYYWLDDWDLFLKVLHPDLNLWNLGSGPFGRGPYKYLHTPFIFLHPFLGLRLPLYFAIGIFLYFLAAASLFFLVLRLTKNKSFAFVTACIFGTICYIGLYSWTHLSNSYQMSLAIIGLCLTLIVFTFFLQTYKYRFYFATVLIYAITIELVYLRVFGIIFLVTALLFLFQSKLKKHRLQTRNALMILFPFFAIHIVFYYLRLSGSPMSNAPSMSIQDRILGLFGGVISTFGHEGGLANLISLLASFSNMIISSSFSLFVHAHLVKIKGDFFAEIVLCIVFVGMLYFLRTRRRVFIVATLGAVVIFLFIQWASLQQLQWRIASIDSFLGLMGGLLLIFFMTLVFARWRSDPSYSRVLLFGVVWVLGQFLSYFLHSPDLGYSGSDSRYFTTSTVGTALIIGSLLALLTQKKRQLYALLVLIIVFANSIYINSLLFFIRKNTTTPTRAMYASLKKEIPSIPQNPIFLVAVDPNPTLLRAFTTSYFDSAVAIFYKLPEKPKVVSTFSELLPLLKNDQDLKRVVAVRIQKDGQVKDYSQKLRGNLLQASTPREMEGVGLSDGRKVTFGYPQASTQKVVDDFIVITTPSIVIPVQQFSLSPSELRLSLTVTPSELPTTQRFLQESQHSPFLEDACRYRPSILRIFSASRSFASRLTAVSASSELSHSQTSNLVDQTSNSWASDPMHWASEHREEIVLSFKEPTIQRQLFIMGSQQRFSPKRIGISQSADGKSWRNMQEKQFSRTLNDYEIISFPLPNTSFSFIKLEILNTMLGTPPSLAEIWTSPYSDSLYTNDMKNIAHCPYCCVTSTNEIADVIQSIGRTITARLSWTSDVSDVYQTNEAYLLSLIPDGERHTYNILLPSDGTMLTEVKLGDFQIPVDVTIHTASIRGLSLSEIRKVLETNVIDN
ncbi:MAG: hypothetical protein HYV40_03195 [Candidatus Levybacteria bacterium]|nr:hypothetical protein [Candidatus Levybacteria bacterium]